MKIPLETQSASALRKLLIDEVKLFVECLDKASVDELQQKRTWLIAIYKAVIEKEKAEMIPIVWGENSIIKTKSNNS